MEDFPRAHDTEASRGRPQEDRGRTENRAGKCRETHHLHVHVQRHRLVGKGQWRNSKEQFIGCFRVCPMFSWRKLDVSRTRQRRDVVWFLRNVSQKIAGIITQTKWWPCFEKVDIRYSADQSFCLEQHGSVKIRRLRHISRAETQTAELLLRTIVAVNQLSIYGVVADWCEEFTQRAQGYPFAEHEETRCEGV